MEHRIGNQVWQIQQNYDRGDDDFDVQIGRGKMYILSSKTYSSTGTSTGIFSQSSNQNSASQNGSGASKFQTPGGSSFSRSQSFIKATGHKYNSAGMSSHVDYISRNGEIDIEDEKGEIHNGEDRDNSIKEWVTDFEERKQNQAAEEDKERKNNNRMATSFVFSSPEGTNTEDLMASVREFAQKNFEGRRYILVAHTPDTEVRENKITDNPHVHLVVENISPGNEKALRTNPDVFRKWRREYAEISEKHGIKTVEMEQRKPAPHEKHQNLYRMLKKGEIPEKYKGYYQQAVNRVERGYEASQKELKVMNAAKEAFINRQKQIEDLKAMIAASSNDVDKFKYSKEMNYLKSINSSMKVPLTTSQNFVKHVLATKNGEKRPLSPPSMRSYIYAEKLAKNHGKKLPKYAHLSAKELSKFIKNHADKPTPKFVDLIKTIAKDKGLSLKNKDIQSHKSAMRWLKEHKDFPTVKQFGIANRIAEALGIELPKELTVQSLKKFIEENHSVPSEQMKSFAEAIEKRSGIKIEKGDLIDRFTLSKYIDRNKDLEPSSQRMKDFISRVKEPGEKQEVEVTNEKINNKTKEKIQQAMRDGFRPNSDDLSSEQNAKNFVASTEAKTESNRWNVSLNAVVDKNPELNKSKTRAISRDF